MNQSRIILSLLMLCAINGFAQNDVEGSKDHPLFIFPAFSSDNKNKFDEHQSLEGLPTSTLLNINHMSMWTRNDGWSARDPATGNAGLFYPRGKVAAIFQDGTFWGGKVFDGQQRIIRVGGQTYSIGTVGGRIVSRGIPADPSDPTVRIYRIRADYRTADLRLDAAELNRVNLSAVTFGMVAAVRAQYERDWNEWPWQQGAPFYDTNHNGIRDPDEAPGLANADQVIWYVANDLNAARTLATYGSYPIGVEMQVTLWGYRSDQLPWSSTILKRVKLIYKGTTSTPDTARIDSMFLGPWSDPDLGDPNDDLAGCDTSLGLNYVYNGRSSDFEYAAIQWPPPAVGYLYLQMPAVNGTLSDSAIVNLRYIRGKKHVPVYSMVFGRPLTGDPPFPRATDYFNWMKGLDFYQGRPFVHPRFPGDTTRFWLDGDPVSGTGRLDSIPGDRRIMSSAGPFTMALGDTQEIVVATIAAVGPTNIESVRWLKRVAAEVRLDYQDLLYGFQSNPEFATPPPSRFFLHQNFPNPFNPSTIIRYEIGFQSRVLIKVFNILGQEVARLVDEEKQPGEYVATWDATRFSSGVYIFSIEAGVYDRTRKGILLK